MKLHGLLGAALVLVFVACAESAADIPGEDDADADAGGSSSGSTLPPSNPPADSGTGSTSSSGSSSGGAKTDSGSQSSGSSSGSSGSGALPACSFGGDIVKLLTKLPEIQAGAPCDASCNATTHCCLDLLGGAEGGLPIDAGLGSGGICVSN